LIEEFFLRLRTKEGIADLWKFSSILIPNYEWLITNYQKEGLVDFDGTKLRLSDEGMNVYNGIVTDLLEKL
jgi:coproporphyrinogen III oxidase-like Fe-S oxidoreductase